MSDLLLSEAEINDLTKPLTQGLAKTRHLERMLGCKLKRRPDGLPVVTRAMLKRLEGETIKTDTEDAGISWSK